MLRRIDVTNYVTNQNMASNDLPVSQKWLKNIATHWMNGFKVTSIVEKWEFQLNLMAWNMPTGSTAQFWTWKNVKIRIKKKGWFELLGVVV